VSCVASNVPIYLIGTEHPNEAAARTKLDALIRAQERLLTDVEVQR
jgi:predicted nucleic acid-binding protein